MNDDPSKELFEIYKTGGIDYINSLQPDLQSESEILDFKLLTNGKMPMERADKKNLSEVISAFTNSNGGVLVWGVDCRNDADGNDVVVGLKPIDGLKKFHNFLLTIVPQSVEPVLTGIEYHPIEDVPNSDRGFLVIRIPRSDGEPVMVSNGRYYVRSGSTCMPMTHTMLADRFGRRPQPKLELSWAAAAYGVPPDSTVRLSFHVHNIGKALAKYPAVRFHSNGTFFAHHLERAKSTYGMPGWHRSPLHYEPTPSVIFTGHDSMHFLHMGQGVDACDLEFHVPVHNFKSFHFDYELIAEGFHRRGKMKIVREEVWAKLKRTEALMLSLAETKVELHVLNE